ncbi:MAG: 6-bladed beta-propeller [Gammaproteobacteria bacterium]|nr:6-bladed beta-propeller [Gammaproteobacteria bacterium]
MKCISFGPDGRWRTRLLRPHSRFHSAAGAKIAVALALVAMASCAAGERDVGTSVVYDSAGVTVVENPEPDRPLGVEVTPIADLIPPDSALTVVPWGVTTDEATGRIYVADRPNDRVVVFDASGRYAGALGRSGDGPGEFRNPVAGTVDPSGSLVVWDSRRRILSRWSSAGDYLGEERPDLDYGSVGFAAGADWVVAVANTGAEIMGVEWQLVLHEGSDTTTLHETIEEMVLMELRGGSFPAAKLFSPTIIWTNREDSIFFLSGPGYRIDMSVGGSPVLSIRRSLDPIEVTQEMAVRKIESGPGPYGDFMRRTGLEPTDIVNALGYEERISPVLSVTAAPDGRLWVTRTLDGFSPHVVDVFDASGRYDGTFDAPGMPVAFVSDSTFVALRSDEFGETTLSLQRARTSQGSF